MMHFGCIRNFRGPVSLFAKAPIVVFGVVDGDVGVLGGVVVVGGDDGDVDGNGLI